MGRCLGGTGASLGGLGLWRRPHNLPADTARLPPGLLQPARLSQERLFLLTGACLEPGELSLMSLVKPLREARRCAVEQSVCKLGTDPALPESPGRALGGGRSAPKEIEWEARGEGES